MKEKIFQPETSKRPVRKVILNEENVLVTPEEIKEQRKNLEQILKPGESKNNLI